MRIDSWSLAAAAGALATFVVATASATAAAAPNAASPVISPRPGQVVTAHRVKLVVRAGHEHGDLRVTLNGRAIGRDFPLARRGTRTLWVANSHGLRHGGNVLRVHARTGYRTRTATVRFTVRRSAPLVGAGRDRSVTAGTPAHLGGHLHHRPGARRKRATRVRWTVVAAPRGSRVRAVAAGATLRPLLKPDRLGTYTLRMTAGDGANAISDTVQYSAIPADPLVPVETQLPPSSSSTGAAQPGLRVGGSEYRMAYLGFANGQGAYFSDRFAAMWQVAAFDRKTLTPLYNRTYGWCLADNTWKYCRSPDNPGRTHEPMFVDPNAELMREAPGNGAPGALVIARTLGRPGADTTPGSYAALLDRSGFFGRPSGGGDRPPIVGPTSYIGVPGMDAGEADVAGRFDGSMSGFLVHDQHYQFHFLPGARPTFDTRVTSCTDSTCTIGHCFGDREASETVPRDRGGYFVTAWDPVTLAFRNQTFATIDGGGEATLAATKGLADFLDSARASGSLIAISTLRGTAMTPRALLPGADGEQPFARVVDTVAAIGGTRHGFLTSATSARAEYTVVGWPGAGEAGSYDAAGRADAARLRGALVPDRASQLRPTNVSSVGAPAERINQMMVRPTSSAWRYPDASSGPGAAIQCIGAALAQGTNIRAIYSDLTTEAAATALQNDVKNLDLEDLEPVDGTSLVCTPAAADFASAQKQLVRELGWVAHVRGYLTALSTPEAAQGGAIWGQALTLGNELDGELAATDANAPFVVDALGFVASMVDLLVPGAGRLLEDGVEEGVLEGEKLAENVTGALSTTSALFWLASTGVQRAADGGPSLDETVAATDLANHLMLKAQAATAAFTPIGDVIVSDPQKLEEVGRWARCRAGVPGGCKAGFEEYAATPAEIERLTDVSLRAMGRTVYGTLVPRAFPSWDVGTTTHPDNPPLFFGCDVTSPFTGAPASSYAAGFDRIENGQRRWRVFLMVHSGSSWSWASQKVDDRMFSPTGDTWDVAGLGMDRLATMRDTPERFDASGASYTCGFSE
ncbi:MAG TPA: hypothetical protein VLK58_25155 [Conexibacter sp.]|nr:hypothetical protein [Conexibacter sp.]